MSPFHQEVESQLDWLSVFGADPQGGISRLLYSPEWLETQNQLKQRMEQAGFNARFDCTLQYMYASNDSNLMLCVAHCGRSLPRSRKVTVKSSHRAPRFHRRPFGASSDGTAGRLLVPPTLSIAQPFSLTFSSHHSHSGMTGVYRTIAIAQPSTH